MVQTLKDFNRNKVMQFKVLYADPFIKLKKYSDAFTSFGPGIDKNGNTATGLTEDITSRDAKGKIQKSSGTRVALENLLDLPDGTLKPTSSYWASYSLKVGADPVPLNLLDDMDLLHYLVCSAQSNVAIGIEGSESNSKAEYVLYSAEQEAKIKVKGRKSLKDAYRVSDKLDTETKLNVLAVYGIVADASSPNTIENKLDEQLEADPALFLKIVQDDYLVHHSLLIKCLDKGILHMDKGAILHQEVIIGHDKDSAAKVVAGDSKLEAILRAKLSGDMDLIKDALHSK